MHLHLRPNSRIYMVALKTFTNLSAERQEEILLASLEEFARNEYRSASLSTIVSKLKLAKGSFYRYFESKQSLYFYLLDYCVATRMAHDNETIGEKPDDFFELMIAHLLARMRFEKKFPLHSSFLNNVLQERSSEELGDIQYKVKLKVLESIIPMVNEAKQNQVFREELDVETIAFSIFRMQFTILEYLSYKHRIHTQGGIESRKTLDNISDNELVETARVFISLFKDGIVKR